jgi:hypothetical protein
VIDKILQPKEAKPEEDKTHGKCDPIFVVVVFTPFSFLALYICLLFSWSVEEVHNNDPIPEQAAKSCAERLLMTAWQRLIEH